MSTPWSPCGRLAGSFCGGDVDALAVDDDVSAFGLHVARELAVDAVVLEQPGVGLGVGEVVDADQLQPAVGPLEDRAGDQAADAAESVDGDFGHSYSSLFHEIGDAFGDLIWGQVEIIVGVRRRRGDAEAIDADLEAV